MAGKTVMTIEDLAEENDFINLFGVDYPIVKDEELSVESRVELKKAWRHVAKLDDDSKDMSRQEVEDAKKGLRIVAKIILPTLPDDVLNSDRLKDGHLIKLVTGFLLWKYPEQTKESRELAAARRATVPQQK